MLECDWNDPTVNGFLPREGRYKIRHVRAAESTTAAPRRSSTQACQKVNQVAAVSLPYVNAFLRMPKPGADPRHGPADAKSAPAAEPKGNPSDIARPDPTLNVQAENARELSNNTSKHPSVYVCALSNCSPSLKSRELQFRQPANTGKLS